MGTSLFWDPVSDLYYSASFSWGGWWPGKTEDFAGLPYETTALPFGTCSLHGIWDTSRYFACPSCTTSVASPLVKFRVYPELPEVPPVLEVRFEDEERPYCCPVCEGCGTVPNDFYMKLGFSTDTAREKCRSCENGIIWR